MNWYIGQDIIAIRDSSNGEIKKGRTFVIKSLANGFCSCHKVIIDVGLRTEKLYSTCPICRNRIASNSISWKSETLFAPLDQDISELTEILTTNHPFEV